MKDRREIPIPLPLGRDMLRFQYPMASYPRRFRSGATGCLLALSVSSSVAAVGIAGEPVPAYFTLTINFETR